MKLVLIIKYLYRKMKTMKTLAAILTFSGNLSIFYAFYLRKKKNETISK